MSSPIDLTRRALLVLGTVFGGSLWWGLHDAAAKTRKPRETPKTAKSAKAPKGANAAKAPKPGEAEPPFRLGDAERKTFEAVAARILPADGQPGAVEAGALVFVERALGREDERFREVYLSGLPALEAVSKRLFGAAFVGLEAAKQDQLLSALESGKVEGWPPAAGDPTTFFEIARLHVVYGYLADPEYGGNREYAGWKVAGYPGPSHRLGAYTPRQMSGEEPIQTPWQELLQHPGAPAAAAASSNERRSR
ncbi:MAG: gluconate 2-dehydrogenase gamma chain [Candidatus Binatota bacterium]|nr:gluconate 2-dehydrogenase gamma chain [Candidatus Binatota bacterium]